ncbi:Gti1/Pac2 family-domain-containing protein [Mycena amicta]|nr:Gti1/Pac2 family-domain-containing protein [Mycena amicta]
MSFRPGLNLGPYLTHPSLYIRDVADAHKVLEAVRQNILPLIRRRLLAHERAQLRSGNIFVWEESEDVDEGSLVRWTDGRRWSQSRTRGDYLLYEEKVETTSEEKQAKAARRASKASDSSLDIPPPPKRKDRPAKQDGLTKQTYSVAVRLPGPDATTRKWHIVAYFSTGDHALLPVVDHYDYFRNLRVPNGIFLSSRVLCDSGRRLPSSLYFNDIDFNSNSARASHSPAPASPSFELVPAVPYRGFSSQGPSNTDFESRYNTSSSTAYTYAITPPGPEIHPRLGSDLRVTLPPLSSLYPISTPILIQRHSSSHTQLSPEDRRILNSLRVAL